MRGAFHDRASTGLDEGVAEAYADELLLHFGEDDLEDDFGDDLDEEDLDDDLEGDDLEDELDELFGLDDDGEDEEGEGFGGISSWPSKVRSADRQRDGRFRPFAPISGIVKGVGKTVGSASDFAASAGQGLTASGYQLFGPPPPILLNVSPEAPSSEQPVVVADKQSLPPVYVSDPSLAAEAARAPNVESTAVLTPSTKFGASFQEGSVRPRQGKEREAVVRGRLRSEKELRESTAAPSAPLVEDGGATPVLLDDGRVVEPSHGRLVIVSCMSCSRLPAEQYGRSGNGCVVCDDYGAILVPASDLSSFAGTERFGFIAALLGALAPLAGPAAQLVGGAVGQKKQFMAQETSARAQKVYDRLKKQIDDKAQAQPPASSLQSQASSEKVSGIGGFLGGLDDLEDLDGDEDLDEDDLGDDESFGDDDEAFGLFEEDDDLDFLEDGDPIHEDLDEDDDDLPEGRIVRILFPRARF